MKKILSLALGVAAVLALSGCSGDTGIGSTSVIIDDLSYGYKISGYDSIKEKSVDLCFNGNDYVYGRGSEYFYGTFYIDYDDIVFNDHTDGGSYRLSTGGEIAEGYTYYFNGINDNIQVESISRSYSVNDCKVYGKSMRTASSLHLMQNKAEGGAN